MEYNTYQKGLTAFSEEMQLTPIIDNIMSMPVSPFKKISLLKALLRDQQYSSDLAISKITYHIHDIKFQIKNFIQRIFAFILSIILIAFPIYRNSHLFTIGTNSETLVSAIDDYHQNDTQSAIVRFEKLMDKNYDEYIIYAYASDIYWNRKDYDKSAYTLLHYLKNIYGKENISYSTRAYQTLKDKYYSGYLSEQMYQEIQDFLLSASAQCEAYSFIEQLIDRGDYTTALSLCENQMASGSDNYKLTCLYSYCLISLNQIDKAFLYIYTYLDQTTNSAVSYEQLYALKSFILPFLEGEQYDLMNSISISYEDLSGDYFLSSDYCATQNEFQEYTTQYFADSNLDVSAPYTNPFLVQGRYCYLVYTNNPNSKLYEPEYYYFSADLTTVFKFENGKYIVL
ncbi:MAG: hypothetical protein J6A75_06260 [Lachnospiraceae bacterium]|nr:hypothetical protein [Lachnospiraceae bacterium]